MKQYYGTLRTSEQLAFRRRDRTYLLHRRQRIEHDRQGLSWPVLSFAQGLHRASATGISQQLEPAQPLECDDVTGRQTTNRFGHGSLVFRHHSAIRLAKGDTGTTLRAGIGLGMKAPAGRIVVLRQAMGAHLKMPHCRAGTVIRHPLDQTVAGPAIRAIDKGISVTPVTGIVQFLGALTTGSEIRR